MDSGIHEVENGTQQLNGSILASKKALGQNIDTVNAAYESFRNIEETAEGASSVQAEISDVIEVSQKELSGIYQFFDEVVKHIKYASNLGTTKSAMFEDIDNLLSQIPLILQEVEP